MAEKDSAEKILADYNDVFADIVNVLLFHGERRISPARLRSVGVRSQYKADSKVHEQERDVSKLYTDGHVTISLFGMENQSRAEKFMPVRVIGYDGASYRQQLLGKWMTNLYPVVTMVLYFGDTHWQYSRHLTDLMNMPEGFAPFVSDYEMKNLFEISFLEPEQVQLFQSDFRYVADYFVQKRICHNYRPTPGVIQHVDAVLKLMSVLTGDRRFEEAAGTLPEKGAVMSEAILDRIENRGIEKGRIEGRAEGREEGRAEGRAEGKTEGLIEGRVEILYTRLHYSPEEIADEIHEPVDVIEGIIRKLPGGC